MKNSRSATKLKMNSEMILASGSVVTRKKWGKEESELLGSQTSRRIGHSVAILQHLGQKYVKRIDKKHQNIEKTKKDIMDLEHKINPPREKNSERRSVFNPEPVKPSNVRHKENQETNEKLLRKTQSYNQAVAENRNMREKIDGLRKERVVLNKIYESMWTSLKSKEKELKITIDKADKAFKDREAIKQEILALQEADEREEAEYQKQVAELIKQIEKERQVKDYIETQEELATGSVQKSTKSTKKAKDLSVQTKVDSSNNQANNLNELINTEKMLRK